MFLRFFYLLLPPSTNCHGERSRTEVRGTAQSNHLCNVFRCIAIPIPAMTAITRDSLSIPSTSSIPSTQSISSTPSSAHALFSKTAASSSALAGCKSAANELPRLVIFCQSGTLLECLCVPSCPLWLNSFSSSASSVPPCFKGFPVQPSVPHCQTSQSACTPPSR